MGITDFLLRQLGVKGDDDAPVKVDKQTKPEKLPAGRTTAQQFEHDANARARFALAGRNMYDDDGNERVVVAKVAVDKSSNAPVVQASVSKVREEVQKKWTEYTANVGQDATKDYARLSEIKGIVAGFAGGDVTKPNSISDKGFETLGLRKDQFLSGLSEAAENTLVKGLATSSHTKAVAKFDEKAKERTYYSDRDAAVDAKDMKAKEARFSALQYIDPRILQDTRYVWADPKNGLAHARDVVCARAASCHQMDGVVDEKKSLAQELGYKYARSLKLWDENASANEVEDAMRFLKMHAAGSEKADPAIDGLLKKFGELPKKIFMFMPKNGSRMLILEKSLFL